MTTPWTPPSAGTWNPLDLYKRQEQPLPLTTTEGDDNKTNAENALNWLADRVMGYTYIAGLSVVLNTGNVAGNVSVVTAGSDFSVLRRDGVSLGFGAIDISKTSAVGTSVLRIENGGTGLGSLGAANQVLKVNASATALEYGTIDLTAYVPYNGANQDLNMGIYSVAATSVTVTGLTASRLVVTDGTKKFDSLSGTGLIRLTAGAVSYDTNTYLTTIDGIAAGGELSGTYANPSVLNSAVIGKVLTGLNLGSGGTILATDTILQAFGKVQNSISAMLGGVLYQGVWNASTNTPTIPVASVSNKGWYYVVNVAGNTNIGGITDWKVGDWVISDGSAWSKVDNTDAVSSVNGYTGAVNLTYADVGAFANPMTTLGDIMYGGASGVATRLAGNTTSNRYFLTSTGSGGLATAPAYFDLFGTANTWSLAQTFTLAPTFSSMTSGSVLFASTSGVLSQDNTKFKYLPTGYGSNSHLLVNATAGSPTAAGTVHILGHDAAGNNALIVQNNVGTTGFRVANNGISYVRGTLYIAANADTPSFSTAISANAIAFNQNGDIYGSVTTGNGYILRVYNSSTWITTVGTSIDLRLGSTFAPTSGTANYTILNLDSTINQTGGANGIIRGVYVNPTLTSVADWRSGEFINGTGTGKFVISNATGITPQGALHVRGNTSTYDFYVENSSGVAGMAIVNTSGVRVRSLFVGTSTPSIGAGLTLSENAIQFNQNGTISTTGGGGGDTANLIFSHALTVSTTVNRWTGGIRNSTSYTAASGDWRIFNYMSDMTINQTGTANGFVAGYGVNWASSTVAYNLKAFYFGFLTSQGSLASYAPNAALLDYQYSNIMPVINASAPAQVLTGLEIALSGSDGAHGNVVRNALRLSGGNLALTDINILLGTTTGTKIGTSTSQKLGFWGATPIIQPTTAITAATFVANTSAIANDTATFDGYTMGQVVKALRNVGLLA